MVSGQTGVSMHSGYASLTFLNRNDPCVQYNVFIRQVPERL